MKTLKAILKNPFLIGTQGFLAAAALIWSTNEPVQPYSPPVSASAVAAPDLAS